MLDAISLCVCDGLVIDIFIMTSGANRRGGLGVFSVYVNDVPKLAGTRLAMFTDDKGV